MEIQLFFFWYRLLILSFRTNWGTSYLHSAASEEKDEKGNSVHILELKI